jgi:hypothetical protein
MSRLENENSKLILEVAGVKDEVKTLYNIE